VLEIPAAYKKGGVCGIAESLLPIRTIILNEAALARNPTAPVVLRFQAGFSTI
jgi:hypothetical protein